MERDPTPTTGEDGPRARKAAKRAKTKSSTSPTDRRTSTRREGEERTADVSENDSGVEHSLCGVRLSVGAEGSAFDLQASSAVLDLMGDEGDRFNQHKRIMKW